MRHLLLVLLFASGCGGQGQKQAAVRAARLAQAETRLAAAEARLAALEQAAAAQREMLAELGMTPARVAELREARLHPPAPPQAERRRSDLEDPWTRHAPGPKRRQPSRDADVVNPFAAHDVF